MQEKLNLAIPKIETLTNAKNGTVPSGLISSGFTTSASITITGRNCARILKPFTLRCLGSFTGGSIGYFAVQIFDENKESLQSLGVTLGQTVRLNKNEYITFASDATAKLMYAILDPDFALE